VTIEIVYILDSLDLPRGRRGTANPPAQRNAGTGRQALERADNQLLTLEKIKTHPIHVIQFVEK
jgi:hypothetical protein